MPNEGHAGPIGLKSGEAVRPTGGDPIETAAFCHLKSQLPHVIGDLFDL